MSISKKDELDAYLKMYNEHTTQARHHETLRGTISSSILALGGAVITIFSFIHRSDANFKSDPVIGVLLLSIGVLGMLVSYKHYERNRLHSKVAGSYRKRIDCLLSEIGGSVSGPNKLARDEHESEYFLSSRYLKLHQLWAGIFIFVVLAGAIIAGVLK